MLREAFYYLLGGVTFLPLCVIALVLHFYFNVPSQAHSGPPSIDADVELTHEKKLAALDLAARNAAIHAEIESAKGKDHPQGDTTAPPTAKRLGPGPATSSAPKPFSSGWLTVRPTFDSDKDASAPAGAASNTPAAIPASLVDSESDPSRVHFEDEGAAAEAAVDAATAKPNAANAGSGYMSQMYRGILDYRLGRAANKKPTGDASNPRSTTSAASAATPTGTAGKESFYCILKSPILYLYSSDDVASPNTECHAAIDLRGKRVSIFIAGLGDTLGDLDAEHPPATTDDEQLGDAAADQQAFDPKLAWKKAKRAAVRDGELFMKRNAIRIVGSAVGRNSSSTRTSKLSRRRPQWFLFCKNNYVMEDWYHALLQASLLPDPSLSTKLNDDGPADSVARLFGKLDDPIGPTFSQDDMASLLVSLDSLPDPLPLRWLNALVGRIFFSVYRTAWLEDYITSKMMKKMNRVKTPGFLGDIKVVEVDVGRRAPGFSRPMLKALTSEGEASMEVAVHYVGEIRITIATTLTLSLGSRFKPYTIPIVLAVVLRSLEGNLLLHVKRPPSNRLWFGFTTMPKMDIDIEPVVSERKVQWGMVTRLIESRLRELLSESIVVPNMDDISFFDTRSLPLRGGIFADAAKKADVLRAEGQDSSATATAAAPATASTQPERDPKSVASALKPSDLLAANKVGTVSAPVSGTATPSSPSRASAQTLADALANEDGQASSILANASSKDALRNRKPGLESSTRLTEPSLQAAARTSSPAAAGLSDLLNRDLAAGGGSMSGSPPRQDAQGNKRRTWFGSGPKSSGSSLGSSSGLSTLGTLGGRSGREQSSLALGNASIERPSQRSHSTSISGKSDSALSVPAEAATRTVSDSSARPASVRSTPSQSSTQVDGLPEPSRDAKQGSSADVLDSASANPSLVVSSASEPVLSLETAENTAASTHRTGAMLEAPSLHDGDDEHDLIDSPSSLTHSTRSSIRSSRSDAVNPDAGTSLHDPSAVALNNAISADFSRQRSRGTDEESLGASISSRSTQNVMPPPPPPRKPTGSTREERPAPRQDAASALSSVQRSRYGLNESDRGVNESQSALANSTSAMLLTSWNKAKASMADKESRQAAARDAKDAIKRGWTNWNTKRTEARRGGPTEEGNDERLDQAGLARSQSSRLSLVPGKSAWLASSPPDPTSFGLGFDRASPEDTRSAAARDKHSSPSLYAGMRSNLTDTDDDNASVHSNSSNRQPYRELRASKKVHGFDSGSADRTHSGSSSSRAASRATSSTAPSAKPASDASSRFGTWDADVPSLTPPAPAFRNESDEDKEDESKRNPLERTLSKDRSTGLSPPALPRRKTTSSSISSTGQTSGGGGVSFIPPAPAATTGLASASGLSDSEVTAPVKPEAALASEASSVTDDAAAHAGRSMPSMPLTPERPRLRDTGNLWEKAETRTPKQGASEQHGSSAADAAKGSEADSPEVPRVLTQPVGANKEQDTDDQAKSTALAEAATPEKPAVKAEQSYAAAVPEQVSSSSIGSGIKKQPGRATMMTVPGIPSMQKAGPQSFSAPPPPEPLAAAKSDVDTSPSAFRAASLFKMPAFGSPILTSSGGGAKGSVVNTTNGASSKSQEAAESSALPAPTQLTSGSGAEEHAGESRAETPASGLGLTQMNNGHMVHKEESSTARPKEASESARDKLPQSQVEEHNDDATFADVAKAQGPAADPGFEEAQLDTGDTLRLGDKEVKVPATRGDVDSTSR
ncbi:conserved hypothetical protein [Sporisorium reilianum SRZ2]|uniref:SMP-LTD domain-containing protein n=1 Tax=Sporisorium reilianum (strain SRZ2) TaxID=999809 RepID=E6ZLH9_SPORE|nr:conserved hypothetical protein [Sporisorium reilianum SRZ2]